MNPYKFLNIFNKFGSEGGFKPGLERIKKLLSEFKNPENKLNIVHVAGTNGKGSTINFMKNIYVEAGYRVGVYTSPSLLRFNERIMVNNKQITDAELKNLIKDINPVIEKLIGNNVIDKPSFFEIVTLIAFIYFYRKNVDLVLLEVGLGGRLDATNVVESPLVSVITNIGFDHSNILGNTAAEIAREKGGIIKKDCPVITGIEKKEALTEIKKIASFNNSKLLLLDEKYNYKVTESSLKTQKFKIINDIDLTCEIKIPGEHQVRNAVLAVVTVNYLQKKFPVNNKQITNGLKNAYWPGRMEIISEDPLLIMDGAHNTESMKNLVKFLKKESGDYNKITFIISILKDKNIEEMIDLLKIEKKEIEVIITSNENERVEAPSNIKKIVSKSGIKNKIIANIKKAIKYKFENYQKKEIIVITGSLYTVAESKKVLNDIIPDHP